MVVFKAVAENLTLMPPIKIPDNIVLGNPENKFFEVIFSHQTEAGLEALPPRIEGKYTPPTDLYRATKMSLTIDHGV